MNFLKSEELKTILPRGKIKKYMRIFEDLFRQIPLGDKEVVLQILNDEFAHHFSKDEIPSKEIKYVTINETVTFNFVFHGSRLMIHTQTFDPDTTILKDGKVHRVKALSPASFISEYCNPEGLIIMEKAFMNYI